MLAVEVFCAMVIAMGSPGSDGDYQDDSGMNGRDYSETASL